MSQSVKYNNLQKHRQGYSVRTGKTSPAFTLVELLIVIVVVAILAAITVVAYNGIQSRVRVSAMQSDLNQAAKAILSFKITNPSENYPTTLAEAGVKNSGTVVLQYSFDNNANPKTFCVTATDATIVGTSYFISSDTTSPTTGSCPSHSANPDNPNLVANGSFETAGGVVVVRTNQARNPSAATGITYWSSNLPGVTITRDATQARTSSTTTGSIMTTFSSSTTASTQLWDGSTTPLVSVTSGETVTISAWVRTSASGKAVTITHRWRDSANAQVDQSASSPIPISSVWSRISFTAIVPTGAVYDHVSFFFPGNTGDIWWLDDVLVEKSATARDYFDGSSPNSGDFTYSWATSSGTSTSTQSALSVPAGTLSNAVGIQSSDWAATGTDSMRIVSTSTISNDSSVNLSVPVLTPGKTYTIYAKCRLTAPLTGSLSSRARRIIIDMNNNGTTWFPYSSPVAPNTAGVHEIRGTFTVPSGNTSNALRVYNGATAGNGDVWWDDIMIVEGNYSGPFYQ